jgi:2-hydroxychromene-2-carboxylate isomerase
LNADALSHAILQALWRDDQDIADDKVIARLMQAVGIDTDPAAFCADAMSPRVQAEFQANAALALTKGVFGSPFYVFAGELFFGQDRLDFLQEVIVGAALPHAGPAAPANE